LILVYTPSATANEEWVMKAAISGLVGLSLLAGLAGPADAGARPKKQRHHAVNSGQSYKYQPVPPGSDYQERIADKLPFGSSIWWEQMVRERRGGRPG
jgi:hypothetical protein